MVDMNILMVKMPRNLLMISFYPSQGTAITILPLRSTIRATTPTIGHLVRSISTLVTCSSTRLKWTRATTMIVLARSPSVVSRILSRRVFTNPSYPPFLKGGNIAVKFPLPSSAFTAELINLAVLRGVGGGEGVDLLFERKRFR